MQVRHNTQLLEQAIDLVVKQSAIPTLEAEAAAHDKIARANAFRRLATGAAIAVAAVGIGIGAMLFMGANDKAKEPPYKETAEKAPEAPKPPVERAGKEKQPPQSEPAEQVAVDKTEPTPPAEPSTPPIPPSKPDVVTVDFTKFLRRETQLLGSTWLLESGHHFTDEQSPSWDRAWCYTRRVINGVDVNVELVNRHSPDSRPQAPISPAATLTSVGLNDDQARELASRCPWLDGSSFHTADFEKSPDRPEPSALVVQDGWDALGYDLPNMPITNVSFEQCSAQCQGDSNCMAITYNKRHSVCFLKGNASVLVKSEEATMAAKPAIAGSLQNSTLVFAKNTVLVGNPYSSHVTRYPDCVMACASDQLCAGFNFDANKLCTLMNVVSSSVDFGGVTSGMKALSN